MSVEIKNVVRAMARLTWNGAAIAFAGRSPGFAGLLRVNPGVYALTFSGTVDPNNTTFSIVVVSATDTVGFVSALTAAGMTVTIVDTGNNPVDASFTIIVHEVPCQA